jgi:hypothetical protein
MVVFTICLFGWGAKMNFTNKPQLRELLLALDYFNESFGIGDELESYIAKRKEDLERKDIPYIDDKIALKKFLLLCLSQLEDNKKPYFKVIFYSSFNHESNILNEDDYNKFYNLFHKNDF